jgi:hypothetical protein
LVPIAAKLNAFNNGGDLEYTKQAERAEWGSNLNIWHLQAGPID